MPLSDVQMQAEKRTVKEFLKQNQHQLESEKNWFAKMLKLQTERLFLETTAVIEQGLG